MWTSFEESLKMIQKRPQFALRLYFRVIKKHHGLFRTENKALRKFHFLFMFSLLSIGISLRKPIRSNCQIPSPYLQSQKLQVNTEDIAAKLEGSRPFNICITGNWYWCFIGRISPMCISSEKGEGWIVLINVKIIWLEAIRFYHKF